MLLEVLLEEEVVLSHVKLILTSGFIMALSIGFKCISMFAVLNRVQHVLLEVLVVLDIVVVPGPY